MVPPAARNGGKGTIDIVTAAGANYRIELDVSTWRTFACRHVCLELQKMCANVQMCMWYGVCLCACVREGVCMCAYVREGVCMCTCVRAHVREGVCMCACVHVYMCAYVREGVCMCACVHMCVTGARRGGDHPVPTA